MNAFTAAGSFLAPYAPKDAYLLPAWLGCFSWALGEPEILAAFRIETGNTWTPGRLPIERMIDDATGADREFFAQFAAWMNATIWGDV
jgi:hypothetical protein